MSNQEMTLAEHIKYYEENTLIAEIDDKQIVLTEKFIKPNLHELKQFALDFRDELDSIVLKKKTSHEWYRKFAKRPTLLKIYPEGGCFIITQIFVKQLLNNLPDYLRDFRASGGNIKVAWGVVREECFQTVLQIGSCFFDVANDAVIKTKPRINIEFSGNTSFRDLKNYKDYIEYKEKYHNSIIRKNPIPMVNEFFPLVDLKNGIEILNNEPDIYLAYTRGRKELDNVPVLLEKKELEQFFDKIPMEKIKNLTQEELFLRLNRMINYFNKMNPTKLK